MEKEPLVQVSSFETHLLQNPITHNSENWDDTAHHWKIVINGVSVSYKTGLGHRRTRRDRRCYNGATTKNFNKTEPATFSIKKYGNFSEFIRQTVPTQPTSDDIIYSLLSDYSCASESFEDFCANCGYNTDSRKALDAYLACQESGKKLHAMKLGKSIAELQELFQDY